uniref:DET1- and DDB1-associated protein 1 n=1 Tax=Strongyloides venezuelensis TaxID=75913 RepID=A0A0K0F542_STRVS
MNQTTSYVHRYNFRPFPEIGARPGRPVNGERQAPTNTQVTEFLKKNHYSSTLISYDCQDMFILFIFKSI